MSPHDRAHSIDLLATILAPQGIRTVTTGGDEIGDFLQARYGSIEPDVVRQAWRSSGIDRLDDTTRAVILGVPMDAGAGFERGSFKGPIALRSRMLLAEGAWARLDGSGVVDVGDVMVNPHLIDDTYYAPDFLAQIREDRGWGRDSDLPVSPHSILRRALELIHALAPHARVLLLGGDHSISRVPVEVLVASERYPTGSLGVVHVDAHTDLLERRDGVPHNFATWAYWANEAIGRGQRLQQLGVRTSGRTRDHWSRPWILGSTGASASSASRAP